MQSFEEVRAFLAAHYTLVQNEPFLISFDYQVDTAGRRQSIFMGELATESGERVLRFSTPIAKLALTDAERCLRFNWSQRLGFMAVSDLAGVPYLHLCENRSYGALSGRELMKLVRELGSLADQLERGLNRGRDVV